MLTSLWLPSEMQVDSLSEGKKATKNDEFFCRRIFLPTLFCKRQHLVFSDLKIHLVYLFRL